MHPTHNELVWGYAAPLRVALLVFIASERAYRGLGATEQKVHLSYVYGLSSCRLFVCVANDENCSTNALGKLTIHLFAALAEFE